MRHSQGMKRIDAEEELVSEGWEVRQLQAVWWTGKRAAEAAGT